MRVLISTSTSFWISRRAVERARELDAAWAFPDHTPLVGEPQHHSHGEEDEDSWEDLYSLPAELPRHDPVLLQVFDELGGIEMCGWDGDRIVCIEVPDDLTYYIGSYTGEWVAEQHRQWFPDTHVEGDFADTPPWVFTKDSIFQPLESLTAEET